MVKKFLARPRFLALLALVVLALGLLAAVAPGLPVVHAQRAMPASQPANTTIAISVTIGANTGQAFAASQVSLGGQSVGAQDTGTGGQSPFKVSPITVDRLVDQLSPVLWSDLATGTVIDLVTIDFMTTDASGRATTPFETIKLQGVFITAIQDVAQSQGVAETITLIYAQITITSFDATGTIINQFTYDVEKGASS